LYPDEENLDFQAAISYLLDYLGKENQNLTELLKNINHSSDLSNFLSSDYSKAINPICTTT